ncbi:MAG: NADH:flavin oxidoreductase, partial [Anaerolineae bacterium]|nr:NADH:flavin oxidoreductase [Anaerolineae bacterium]
MPTYRRLATLRTPDAFRSYLKHENISLQFDDQILVGRDSPLGQPVKYKQNTIIGNHFCVQPMEGWDGHTDGTPTDLTFRRWKRFGQSGAKLIWGGEAVAVQPDGRANPNQLMINPKTVKELSNLRNALIVEHADHFGNTDDLLIGLQLTHSGRFARPYDKARLEPKILYHHPLLDPKFGTNPDQPVMTDATIAQLIETFISSAKLAYQAGFHFVDLKHCHGYLGHEFLSAYTRPGRYGGSFENRTRFLRDIVSGIRTEVPGLDVGVRFSAIDFVPFRPGADGIGEPTPFEGDAYQPCFGGDGSGTGINLDEAFQFLDLLASMDIKLVNVTVGSPYYNPHIQRPALFPPSDGYQP